MWGTEWKPQCGWQLHVNVSLGIPYSFISFISSSSSSPELSPTTSIWLLLGLWSIETIRIRAVGPDAQCRLSLYARLCALPSLYCGQACDTHRVTRGEPGPKGPGSRLRGS